jgi:hypothetical protein
MNRTRPFAALAVLAVLVSTGSMPAAPQASETLRSPDEFAGIADVAMRSAALFSEVAKVLQSPRCVNCHPPTRIPTQGDDLHEHVPLIEGGAGNHGVPGLPCSTCHTGQNVTTLGQRIATVPGAPHWSLAPLSMAWRGLSAAEICTQLKDPSRNGGRSLAQIHTHGLTDPLVAWGWQPGDGRAPAPGTQEVFATLVAAWIETGAHCPTADTADGVAHNGEE